MVFDLLVNLLVFVDSKSNQTGKPCLHWSTITSRPHRQELPENYCRNDDASPSAWCYTHYNTTTGELRDEPCFSDSKCDECLIVQNRLVCEATGKVCHDADMMVDKGVDCVVQKPSDDQRLMQFSDVTDKAPGSLLLNDLTVFSKQENVNPIYQTATLAQSTWPRTVSRVKTGRVTRHTHPGLAIAKITIIVAIQMAKHSHGATQRIRTNAGSTVLGRWKTFGTFAHWKGFGDWASANITIRFTSKLSIPNRNKCKDDFICVTTLFPSESTCIKKGLLLNNEYYFQ